MSHGGQSDAFGGATTPEESAALGDKVVRISYHRRMYGLGEVSFQVYVVTDKHSTTTRSALRLPK